MKKRTVKQINRVFYFAVGLVLLFIIFQCLTGSKPTSDAYIKKNSIDPQIAGKIIDKVMSKGNGLNILVQNNLNQKEVSYPIIKEDRTFYQVIKTGDYFTKMGSSNKCSIQRGDSVLYFDCFDRRILRKSISDSMDAKQFWDKGELNHWIKIK